MISCACMIMYEMASLLSGIHQMCGYMYARGLYLAWCGSEDSQTRVDRNGRGYLSWHIRCEVQVSIEST